MADSLYNSLLNTVDTHSVSSIANALGQRSDSVLRGLQTSITSLFAGLINKSGDSGTLRKLLDLVPGTGDLSWSRMAGELSNPNSPALSSGRQMVSGLFGNSEGAITDWISRESSLTPGAISKIMSMAAPMVLGFLARRKRTEGMNMTDLGRSLQQESSAVRGALPAGLASLIPAATTTTTTTTTAATSPVVAQAVRHERGFPLWIPAAIAIALALFGISWGLSHRHRPTTAYVAPTTGTASREAPPAPTPMPNVAPAGTLPRVNLMFVTGSATPRPGSRGELRNVASFLVAHPNVHVAISGFTDNAGNAAANQRLSQARADGVMAELVRDGVSPDRLTAHGYGEQNPIASNSSAQGRLQNRRVTIAQQ